MYVNERFIAFHLAERCRLALWQMSEIAEVVRTVKSLATGRADGYRQSEIGVITPWREQVWRIRLKLREAG
jgi:superfamily I DNA and/or RNA helicase